MAKRLAEQEERHKAAIKAERDTVAQYKKELEEAEKRHALQIRDIRDQAADSRKAQQEEMRKLGTEYTNAAKAASAAQEKIQAQGQQILSLEQKIKGFEADIQTWLTRLHVLDIQFGGKFSPKPACFFFFFAPAYHAGLHFYFDFLSLVLFPDVFPESTVVAHAGVCSERKRLGQDVKAPWGILDFLNSLKNRVPPMSRFGQDLLKPCVKTLNALWPGINCQVDATFLSNKLDGVDERLSEWRESAARAAADEVLSFVLSWYEDIDLDCLRTLRDGSKWMDDPELAKRRKQRAHAIAQYSTCHHWTPDMCPEDEKVDPYLEESSDGQYADSDPAGNEVETLAVGDEGTSAPPATDAGTEDTGAAAGIESSDMASSDPSAPAS
jgi:hypothetical protein